MAASFACCFPKCEPSRYFRLHGPKARKGISTQLPAIGTFAAREAVKGTRRSRLELNNLDASGRFDGWHPIDFRRKLMVASVACNTISFVATSNSTILFGPGSGLHPLFVSPLGGVLLINILYCLAIRSMFMIEPSGIVRREVVLSILLLSTLAILNLGVLTLGPEQGSGSVFGSGAFLWFLSLLLCVLAAWMPRPPSLARKPSGAA